MAKYENLGYCPNNSFFQFKDNSIIDEAENVNAERALTILGPRTAFMVYDKGDCTYNGYPYVVDAICGATGTMGIEIATAIKVLDPICEYPDKGLKLSCYDMINPCKIPGISRDSDNDSWKVVDGMENTFVFEDERFLAVVVKTDEELELYFWKK